MVWKVERTTQLHFHVLFACRLGISAVRECGVDEKKKKRKKKCFIYNSFTKCCCNFPKRNLKSPLINKMSHRKVYSQGSIPFSWEDKPGISKVTTNQEHETMKIPLPPCPSKPPRRSTSSKDFKWQEDPFLVAYKECTKTVNNGKLSSSTTTTHGHDGVKKGCVVIGSKLRKTKFMFSCKSSCDAREDNFIKLCNLPPLPRHKIRSLW